MIKIIFLGTASGDFNLHRSFSTTLIETPDEIILVDCGSRRVLSHVDLNKLSKIFISHPHMDHILFLGPLIYKVSRNRRVKPLQIYCPKGTKGYISFFIRLFSFFKIPRFVKFIEISIETVAEIKNEDYIVLGGRSNHLGPSLCYAFQFPEGKITFASDTEAGNPNIIKLAKKSKYLIHEGTFSCGKSANLSKFWHSTALGAGFDARLSESEVLIITHINDLRFKDKRKLIREVRREFSKKIIVAADLLELTL